MSELMRDPVCGMDIGVEQAISSVVADGRRFYVCCRRCHAALLDTPHRYVGWPSDPVRPHPAPIATGAPTRLEPCHFAS